MGQWHMCMDVIKIGQALIFPTKSSIDAKIEHVEEIIASIADAILKCKFEASDSVTDEATLFRLLQLIAVTVESPMGMYITDDMFKSIFDTCFSICFQMRLGELLRRTSENTIFMMIKTVLSRIPVELGRICEEKGATPHVIVMEDFLNRLISLINPADYTGTQHIRLVCLRLMCFTLEMGGDLLKKIRLIPSILEDNFCRYLFTVNLNMPLIRSV